MGGWFRKEIKEVADLQGLKMRIGGFAGTVMAKLGVVPQQIAGGEIYSALEKGTIDAAEWVGPYDDEKLGFQKIAPYYYYPGWWEGGAMLHNFFNIEKWNSLPPAYKSILTTASAMANEWMLAKYDALNPAALKSLLAGRQAQAAGSSRPPSWKRASRPRSKSMPKCPRKNADFKKVWEKLLAFRNDAISVVARRRIHLRRFPHPQPHPHVSADGSARSRPSAAIGSRSGGGGGRRQIDIDLAMRIELRRTFDPVGDRLRPEDHDQDQDDLQHDPRDRAPIDFGASSPSAARCRADRTARSRTADA